MRIGFFAESYPPQPDGVATATYEMAEELRKRGHDIKVIAPKYPGHKDTDPNVIRIASVKIHKQPEIRMGVNIPDKALRSIFSMDFDIIHGHSGGFITFLGWEIAREKKIPFLFTYHTLWNRYTEYFLKGKVVKPKTMEQVSKFFGNIVDCLIAPTKRVEKELRRYGVKKPIVVIPSGLPLAKFRNAKPGHIRKVTGIKKDPIVLYAGRLGPEKSVDFIISSFKHVVDDVPTAQLVLVGDGVERKKLEALARKLGIFDNCHFLGHINSKNMPDAYRDASVFVFSSTSETQGLVVPEALSTGTPVVAIDDPAFECVISGVNGYLVKKNEKEFAQKVASIISDKELHDKLSKNASRLSESFSIENTVDKLEEVYFDLLDKRNIESVPRIMGENARAEKAYTTSIIFWTTVVFLRLFALIFATDSIPVISIGARAFLYPEAGSFLILIFIALFLHKRQVSFGSLVALGVGLGLVADEALALLFPMQISYWSLLSLIPIVGTGIISGLFTRTNSGVRPKFYINTRMQKHENPKNPKVSIVIPAYNEGEFIGPTLKSLINQTYKNFEIIVVDNNSSDNTAEVAKRYGARVVTQPIKGVAAARDLGFREARGEIIASTDADTVLPQDWVARIADAFESKNVVGFAGLNLLYSGAVSARAAGRYLFPIFWWIDNKISGGWNMAGFNMAVRKSAFLKVGGFKKELKMGEDIDLSQKLRTVGKIKIDMSLVAYSSGRRYSRGLLAGMMSYAPWWISKVLLKQDKPFEFADVRDEKTDTAKYSFVPISVLIMFLAAVFFLAARK